MLQLRERIVQKIIGLRTVAKKVRSELEGLRQQADAGNLSMSDAIEKARGLQLEYEKTYEALGAWPIMFFTCRFFVFSLDSPCASTAMTPSTVFVTT